MKGMKKRYDKEQVAVVSKVLMRNLSTDTELSTSSISSADEHCSYWEHYLDNNISWTMRFYLLWKLSGQGDWWWGSAIVSWEWCEKKEASCHSVFGLMWFTLSFRIPHVLSFHRYFVRFCRPHSKRQLNELSRWPGFSLACWKCFFRSPFWTPAALSEVLWGFWQAVHLRALGVW